MFTITVRQPEYFVKLQVCFMYWFAVHELSSKTARFSIQSPTLHQKLVVDYYIDLIVISKNGSVSGFVPPFSMRGDYDSVEWLHIKVGIQVS